MAETLTSIWDAPDGRPMPAPVDLECPLTMEVMENPVMAEGDGYTCEC